MLLSFYVRKRIGQKTWRQPPLPLVPAFLAATAHGLMAGTDSAASWALTGYGIALATVLLLLTYRILVSVAARRRQGASAAGASGAAGRSASARQDASGQAA